MAVSSAWHDLCFKTKHNSWGIDCCTCRSHSVNSLFCFGWWVLGPISGIMSLKQVLLVHCPSLLEKKKKKKKLSLSVEELKMHDFDLDIIYKFQISGKRQK